jgi:hypothetical protein
MSMAAVNHGEAFLYGLGEECKIPNCAVQSVSRKRSFANVAEVVNEEGNTITKRYNDKVEEVSIELIPKPAFNLEVDIGMILEFQSKRYIIESIDDKRGAKEFVKYTLSCKTYEYIQLSGPVISQ